MIRQIHIEIAAEPEPRWLIAPRPFPHWGQRFERFEAEGAEAVHEIAARNSDCRAYLLRAGAGRGMSLRYEVSEAPELSAPDWVWRTQSNRYTRASAELQALASRLAQDAPNQRAALQRLAEEAAEVFDYGHVEERFNAGLAEAPMICGTTKGSCVDINTYILAAALGLGMRGQYVAGYWFHPEKSATADMHCWLAFEPDGHLVFWDVAHALKWADTLGARLGEGLNPAGGRRVAMSCGRGLAFDTPLGAVEISHFSEPMRLKGDGAAEKAPIGPIRLTETPTAAEAAA